MVKTWLFQDLMPERTPERTKKAYVFVDDRLSLFSILSSRQALQ